MTPEQSDTLDALYSGGMLTGKVFWGVISVLLLCHYYEFVKSKLAKNPRYAFTHPIAFGKKQTLTTITRNSHQKLFQLRPCLKSLIIET